MRAKGTLNNSSVQGKYRSTANTGLLMFHCWKASDSAEALVWYSARSQNRGESIKSVWRHCDFSIFIAAESAKVSVAPSSNHMALATRITARDRLQRLTLWWRSMTSIYHLRKGTAWVCSWSLWTPVYDWVKYRGNRSEKNRIITDPCSGKLR